MATVAEIQAQIDALNAKLKSIPDTSIGNMAARNNLQTQIGKLQPQLAAAQKAATPIAQVAPQASTPREVVPPPVQPTTPVAQVAPQSTKSLALQNANSEFFPNIDPNTGLPIVKQSAIDAELNAKKTNQLTANNSNIRDAIYGSGWNAKSDAVQVLNGAGVYGLVKPINAGIMGTPSFTKPNGAPVTDQDFINAAKEAGVDVAPYYQKQPFGMGGTQNVLDKNALYNAINDKSKDLYSITNTLQAADRGEAAPHATILFKADGQGNLVPQVNQQTGQPEVQYSSATRYAEAPSFMDTYGPFLSLAPAFGGILQANGIIPSFGNATGTAADASLGFNVSQVAPTSAAAQTAGIGGGFSGAAAGLPLSEVSALTSASTPAQIAAMKTTGDVVAGGTLANGIGMGAGAAAGGNAIANAINAGTIASGVGSVLGAGAAYSGAQMQADAAKQAAANQMSMFNTINNQLQPQRGAGYQSLNQIRSMLPGQYTTYDETGKPVGTAQGTDYLTRQFTPQDLQAGLAPNYQFMLNQGQQQTQRQANLAGGAMGGNALRALQDYTQNYAGNAYQNAFQNFNTQRTGIYNTLAGIAGIGQNATNTSAQAGQNAVNATSQLGVGSAAAQAAGMTGVANAVQGGLQNYQQNQILQAVLGQNQNVAQYQNTAAPFNVA